MTKQTLFYNSASDPLGSFIVYEEGKSAMDSYDMESYLRKQAIKYLVSKLLPFNA